MSSPFCEVPKTFLTQDSPCLTVKCEARHLKQRSVSDVLNYLESLGFQRRFVHRGQLRPIAEFDQTSPKVYVDQVVYLNREVMRTIDAICSKSKIPPIIIVQSDHGPGYNSLKDGLDHAQERVPILNAYLVPESMQSELYPTITPVNTFRLLLSKCFGVDYAPLPDRNFLIHETIWSSILEVSDKVHDGTPEPGLLSPAVVSKANSMAKREATTQMD